ncbi:MAG: MFS transporter [Gemmataceae bacterium]
MHFDPVSPTVSHANNGQPWWSGLTRYHYFVFTVAALGWLADCMDQNLFTLAREDAIADLLHVSATDRNVTKYATWATSVFLIGWGTGGLIFGIMGDRLGRVKTMMLTILFYSVFTGLSAWSVGVVDFILYRFLSGLGVGGEFAVGVALLAETMPDKARSYALGSLQAFSAAGNISAALVYMLVGMLEQRGFLHELSLPGFGPAAPWRYMFLIGLLPALLALIIRGRLREPERWQAVAGDASPKRKGSYAELFGNQRWRKNAVVGVLLAFSGVVGLWGIGFFSGALQKIIFRESFGVEGMTGDELEGQVKFWVGVSFMVLNVGAFFGIYAFSWLSQATGRKPAFAVSFVSALLSTALVFGFMKTRGDIFWMIPLMGFCLLSLFGGYAIYFPELFPTHLRSTGTSFCYNVGRFVAASGPTALGFLASQVYGNFGEPAIRMRYAGVTMCAVFLIGLAVLPFAPETKGQPLPE